MKLVVVEPLSAALASRIIEIEREFSSVIYCSNDTESMTGIMKELGNDDTYLVGNVTLPMCKRLGKSISVLLMVVYDLTSMLVPISSLFNLGIKVLNSRDLNPRIEFNGKLDSWLLKNVFDNDYSAIIKELEFGQMFNRQSAVPRLITVQCDLLESVMPIYRHPADAMPVQHSWTPHIFQIKTKIEQALNLKFNHALIQLYRNGNDFINEHSDKTLDITPGSKIVTVSFGSPRFLILSSKIEKQEKYNIRLDAGSVFVLGLETNRKMKHSINKDFKCQRERLSLTFRNIHTFTDGKFIWGGGATMKSRDTAQLMNNVHDPNLIKVFGIENRDPEFDSHAHYYMNGFD